MKEFIIDQTTLSYVKPNPARLELISLFALNPYFPYELYLYLN